jgi:integrase/recombinase XerD
MSNEIKLVESTIKLAPEQSVQITAIDLATLIAEFITFSEFSDNTREAYKQDLQKLWDFTQGDISDSRLISFKVKRIMNDENGAPRPARSANRILSSTRSFLDYLVHRRILQTNIFANKYTGKGKKIDKTDSPYVALNDAEVRLMLDHPDRSTYLGSCQRLALVLGFYFGLRASEIVGLRFSDIVDMNSPTGKGLRIMGKGSKTRILPLDESLMGEIHSYVDMLSRHIGTPDRSRYILTSTAGFHSDIPREDGAQVNRATVWRWFTQTAKACGIEKHFSPHSARATAITTALENGVSIRDVANLAGHSSVDTTSIYDKRRGEASLRAVRGIKY